MKEFCWMLFLCAALSRSTVLGDCLEPDVPSNGYLNCPSNLRTGMRCRYGCSHDYRLVGIPFTTCILNPLTGKQVWKPRFQPKCIPLRPVDCYPIYSDMRNGGAKCNRVFNKKGDPELENVFSICTFYCLGNYTMVGPSSAKCLKDGSWTDDAPKCARGYCPKLEHSVDRIDDCTDWHLLGSKCEFSCRTGSKLLGPKSITCRKDPKKLLPGVWSQTPPRCEVIACKPPPTEPDGGLVSCTREGLHLSVCTYTCRPGFDMDDTVARTKVTKCLLSPDDKETGRWTAPAPTCTEVLCHPARENPENGQVVCSNLNRISSFCAYTCNRGYDMDGTDSYIKMNFCDYNRNYTDPENIVTIWNGSPATCSPIVCKPTFDHLANGNLTCSDGNHMGSVCTFWCDKGYGLGGKTTVIRRTVCMDDYDADNSGKWSLPPATCDVIKCRRPYSNPLHGTVSCTNGNLLGSKCTFSCDDGYFLDREAVSVCEDIKQDQKSFPEWTAPRPPRCNNEVCDEPDYDRTMLVRDCKEEDKAEKKTFGTVCTYTCRISRYYITEEGEDGIPKRSKTIETECLPDKTWSQGPPLCEPAPTEPSKPK